MKVLFAVSNENISTQIVKKYQKEYKEIISYKNVYYFDAIVKELQRDKSYNRIVISEDLEPFANNNFDEIEKFIFGKLDSISDEATGLNGKEIPIILLASDKRKKSDTMLSKLFGIGIYDVLLAQDRSTGNVCSLLNNPRTKKEAKIYYKIESEEVTYKTEKENNVSEAEIKNILTHYRMLGKDEERYIESFNNIAAQYNDAQLRIITKFLPLNVKAVLEQRSPKYQSVMTFSDTVSTAELMRKKKEEEGLKIGFLNYANSKKPSEPVIVPKAVKKVVTKQKDNNEPSTKIKKELENKEIEEQLTDILPGFEEIEEIKEDVLPGFDYVEEIKEDNNLPGFDNIEEVTNTENEVVKPIKRGRGRPKKILTEEQEKEKANVIKRGRGRPRKNIEIQEELPLQKVNEVEEDSEESLLPGFDNLEDVTLPGFDAIEETTLPGFEPVEDATLPGFDEIEENVLDNIENESIDEKDEEDEEDTILPGFDEIKEGTLSRFDSIQSEEKEEIALGMEVQNTNTLQENNDDNLLLKDKKVVSFVGTTKNGTSFLVNNLGQCLSSMGIKTAILDLTSNRNSYYIYTENKEQLRNIGKESIKKLRRGITEGITVDKNLDVYTGTPGDELELENVEDIISTLIKRYSVILVDADFSTPVEYFRISEEIYIVQTMDILTIQPMTAFLRDLKAKEILEPEKLRIVINKELKVKGLTPKVIIGGLAYYNDPAMSFMTELFDKDKVKYCTIPFDQEVLSKYLEGVMDCKIKTNKYPKTFNKKIEELANMVYPLLGKKQKNLGDYSSQNTFSSEMNNTLKQMKNKY